MTERLEERRILFPNFPAPLNGKFHSITIRETIMRVALEVILTTPEVAAQSLAILPAKHCKRLSHRKRAARLSMISRKFITSKHNGDGEIGQRVAKTPRSICACTKRLWPISERSARPSFVLDYDGEAANDGGSGFSPCQTSWQDRARTRRKGRVRSESSARLTIA